jgi:hypothetical protein
MVQQVPLAPMVSLAPAVTVRVGATASVAVLATSFSAQMVHISYTVDTRSSAVGAAMAVWAGWAARATSALKEPLAPPAPIALYPVPPELLVQPATAVMAAREAPAA